MTAYICQKILELYTKKYEFYCVQILKQWNKRRY